jgi:hypothetical protein
MQTTRQTRCRRTLHPKRARLSSEEEATAMTKLAQQLAREQQRHALACELSRCVQQRQEWSHGCG